MLRTAESVSPSHPDKIADRISDAILDEALRQDPFSRVAVETMGGHGIITVTGEMTTKAFVDVREVVRRIVGDKYGVQVNIVRQSPEISQGVDTGGAGDQGIMVGYACNETKELMPLEVILARRLCQYIYKECPYDGKTQVTLDDNKLVSVVASFQNVSKDELDELVVTWLTDNNYHKDEPVRYINPAGDWSIGGFEADTGLTGRKIAVDSYGPRIPIGGGAFSGKDATKVDRSGAYAARQLAVQVLKEELYRKEVIVRIAYAIGKKEPLEISVIIDGMPVQYLNGLSFEPLKIIERLDLRKPQFEKTAEWGHFGNDFTWDK